MQEQSNRGGWLALMVAVIAGLSGIQATMARKAEHRILVASLELTDTWSWYQAKATREALVSDPVEKARYAAEKLDLRRVAGAKEEMRDIAIRQSAEYDFAGAMFSTAILLAGLAMMIISMPVNPHAIIGLVFVSTFIASTGCFLLVHGFFLAVPDEATISAAALVEYFLPK